MMMGGPRTSGRPDEDGVFIRRHDMLNVRRHEEKASDGVALHLRVVANGQLQYALNDGDPCVRAVGVPVMISAGINTA